ncbi:MAG: glycine rich domain-containing protein [Candidatus Cybelea sp.]
MRALAFGGFALSCSAAAALLAGCSGSQSVDVTPTAIDPQARSHHQTFSYTGHEQTFTVPAGVTWITVVAQGAGGGGPNATGPTRGFGGRVRAQLPVRPGERLYVFVGGVGSMPHGGYNGGGQGLSNNKIVFSSYGGGGASDIREGGKSLGHRVLVAGGGGGFGGYELMGAGSGSGGAGGGSTAGSGSEGSGSSSGTGAGGGDGGSQESGGTGGQGGGGAHKGRTGGNGLSGTGGGAGHGGGGGNGGGAGGGYYGGGGGGGGGADNPTSSGLYRGGGGGGGGGSSYHERSARKYRGWQGWADASGDGLVDISW